MTFLGIRPGPITGFSQSGPDPRDRAAQMRRYQLWLQQQRAQGAVAPQRRGGAQPPPNVYGGDPTSPTADAVDQRYAWAQSNANAAMTPQELLQGVSSGELPPPEGPVHLPGFQAPRRHLFARRGLKGYIRPGDMVTVGEGGPETLTVDTPANVKVVPGFNTEDSMRATIEADRLMKEKLAREGQVRAGRQALARTNTALSDRQLSGAEPAPGAAEAVQGFQAGEAPAYTYNNAMVAPSARRDIMAQAQAGANPYRDRIRARMQAEADARVPAAQAQLAAAAANNGPAKVPLTPEEIDARRKAAGLSSTADVAAHRAEVSIELRSRAQDRRDAAELGISVGQLKRQRQAREDAYANLNAQVAIATNQAQAKYGGQGAVTPRVIEENAAKIEAETTKATGDPKQGAAAGDAYRQKHAAEAQQAAGGQAAGPMTPEEEHQTNLLGALGNVKDIYDDTSGSMFSAPQFEQNVSIAEQQVGMLEDSKLTPDQKRIIAINALQAIDKGWKKPSAIAHPISSWWAVNSAAYKRREALRERLQKLAISKKADAKPAATQPARGEPKRAGLNPGYDKYREGPPI